MSSYRLKPRVPLWKIVGVSAALLFAPAPVSLVMPQLVDDRSPVTLGAAEGAWSNVIEWPDGGDLVCEDIGDDMIPAWDCGGAKIHAMVMEGSRDEENTLQRAMRVLLSTVEEGEWVRDDGILLYETDEGIGISQEGEGDYKDLTMIAVVTGEKQREYSAIILHDMRGGEGELPNLEEIGVGA